MDLFSRRERLFLRLGLLVATWGWGISFAFLFSPWEASVTQLQSMGLSDLTYEPILDYWLRMAAATFGCVGMAAGLACWKPERFRILIQLLGPFHLFLGIVLLVAAQQNALRSDIHTSYVVDIPFCFLVGVLLLIPTLTNARRLKATARRTSELFQRSEADTE